MQDSNDGGPAFPFACQGPTTAPEIYYGMSLRDWFAGQALSAFAKDKTVIDLSDIASDCYTMADAMLEARKK